MITQGTERLHLWKLFVAVQAAGAACLVLPFLIDRITNRDPHPVSVLLSLAGIIVLLPGSIVALVVTPFEALFVATWSGWRILAGLFVPAASVAANYLVFSRARRFHWRGFASGDLRTWLVLAGWFNLAALVLMRLCFPSAGREGRFGEEHVLLVFASVAITLIALAVIGFSLLTHREFQLAAWIVVIVQFVRLLPVSRALDYWPGGDDGPGMGWQMFVIPLSWILAIAGAATCLWCWRRAATW